MSEINGYILSYNNPDTDSVCSSIALAHYYRLVKNQLYVPVISGRISEETRYVLNTAGINPDTLMNNAIDSACKVIIVDTHQIVQIPYLKDPNRVVEIWDHHPDGDVFENAIFNNYKIGAIASKIVELLYDNNILNQKLAILLGSSIISNTINFIAPSTTSYDHRMMDLAKSYFSFDGSYIEQMLAKRDVVLELDASDIIISDLKEFNINGTKSAVSQVEVSSANKLIKDDSLLPAIKTLVIKESYCVYICNIIDISKKISYLIPGNAYSLRIINETLGYSNENEKVIKTDRVLLRKTDIIPAIMERIQNEAKE